MRSDLHSTEVPRANDPSTADDQSLWAFLPILVALAAICLLTYFFLTPSFEAAYPAGGKSVRPGAMPAMVQQDQGG
jgi:hypothetical protein